MLAIFAIAGVCVGSVAGVVRAHGDVPRSNGVSFGSGGLLFSTNFGGLTLAEGETLRYLCEGLVDGGVTPVDRWVRMPDGRVLTAGTSGAEVERGLRVSRDASACRFEVVPGSEELHVAAVVNDPRDATRLYAAGWRQGAEGRDGVVLAGPIEGPLLEVYRRSGEVTALVGDGDEVVGSLVSGDATTVIARRGSGWDEVAADSALGAARVIGVRGGVGRRAWLVTTEGASAGGVGGVDSLWLSDDLGASADEVARVEGRLSALVVGADGERVWVQGPVSGVSRSVDGGRTFAALAGSPHGSCLALRERRLFACGVPWRDGMVFGVSDDGETFSPLVESFDEIALPLACPDAPEVEAACARELTFVRIIYGLSTPSTRGEPGGEPVVEAVVERDADATDADGSGAVEGDVGDGDEPRAGGVGCGAGRAGLSALGFLAAGFVRSMRSVRARVNSRPAQSG